MREEVYIGFDFGFKRIGVAVGQKVTLNASPLVTLPAKSGVPDWQNLKKLINQWQPKGLVVGFPTKIDGEEQYTSEAARVFASQLHEKFELPVFLIDERLTSVEARGRLFEKGGYKRLKSAAIDSYAACIILEQWLRDTST